MNPLIAKQTFSGRRTITLTDGCGVITGDFVAIQILDDTGFHTLEDSKEFTADEFGGEYAVRASEISYHRGDILYGRFTKIGVDFGACRVTVACPIND